MGHRHRAHRVSLPLVHLGLLARKEEDAQGPSVAAIPQSRCPLVDPGHEHWAEHSTVPSTPSAKIPARAEQLRLLQTAGIRHAELSRAASSL